VVPVQGKAAAAGLAGRAGDVHLDDVDVQHVDLARHGLESSAVVAVILATIGGV
jgi:hypothetical protein